MKSRISCRSEKAAFRGGCRDERKGTRHALPPIRSSRSIWQNGLGPTVRCVRHKGRRWAGHAGQNPAIAPNWMRAAFVRPYLPRQKTQIIQADRRSLAPAGQAFQPLRCEVSEPQLPTWHWRPAPDLSSTRRTASTAKPATSRIPTGTSTGRCRKAVRVRSIRTCSNMDLPRRRFWYVQRKIDRIPQISNLIPPRCPNR